MSNFSDQFRGGLDLQDWAYGTPSTTGGQIATFVASAVTTDAAGLHLTARRDSAGHVISGKIESIDVYRYGRFEFVARLPSGKGFWPGLWLRTPEGSDANNIVRLLNGEIDCLEGFGSLPHTFQSTLHHWRNGQFGGQEFCVHTAPVDLSLDYHTYMVEWRPDHVKWLLDGEVFFTVTQRIPSAPMRIVLSLNVGGSFDGSIDSTTHFPASLDVRSVTVSP